MADNFLACDRDQVFLLPPDLRDWLPADHLAWFVLDVVDQLDLGPFLAGYRADGHGQAAYQPRMLLAVLLSSYCTGSVPPGWLAHTCDQARSGWPARKLRPGDPPRRNHARSDRRDTCLAGDPRRRIRLYPGEGVVRSASKATIQVTEHLLAAWSAPARPSSPCDTAAAGS
jgi:hypothetical protein